MDGYKINQTITIDVKVLMAIKGVQNLEAREINYISIATNNHFIYKCYKLKNKEKRANTYREKGKSNDKGNACVHVSDADNSDGETLVAFAG